MNNLQDAVLLKVGPHRPSGRQHAGVGETRPQVWVLLRTDADRHWRHKGALPACEGIPCMQIHMALHELRLLCGPPLARWSTGLRRG